MLELKIEKYCMELNCFEETFSIIFNDKRNLIYALDHMSENSEKKKEFAFAGDALLDFLLFQFLMEKGGYTRGMMDEKGCSRVKYINKKL